MTAHTTFGTAEVFGQSVTFDRHHILDRVESVFVDHSDIDGVLLKFGWGDTPYPICGKCRAPMRPVQRPDGTTVWMAEGMVHWTPLCDEALGEDATDAEVVENMWHEPDRSVGSWCRSAAIRVNDGAGTLSFVARTTTERIVVRLTRPDDGQVQVATDRRRRRDPRLKEAAR
jgi:hypothetical protein